MATNAGRRSAPPPADPAQQAVPRTRAEARALAEASRAGHAPSRGPGRTPPRHGQPSRSAPEPSARRAPMPPVPVAPSRVPPSMPAAPLTRSVGARAQDTGGGSTRSETSWSERTRSGTSRPETTQRRSAPATAPVDRDTVVLTRRELRARERELDKEPKRSLAKPLLAGGLAVGLVAGITGYAGGFDLGQSEAAFVVGNGVSAQTDELARARTVDTTYRAAASVSRNERRTAITVAGARDAAELEAKAKAEAARRAREAEIAQRKAELERMREQAIANARENPQAAARVLMLDHGWTSDAQYNCLVNLWNGESDWRYTAENPYSGAYGIPQSLPGRKMSKFGDDWRTNPITQIKWGLWYIDEAYGSPCNAWSTWQARSPHWY